MDAEFWHERWRENRIGFHEGKANALLAAHFEKLSLDRGSRVFLPLCGKTRDIGWLMARGVRVVGAELSATATEQLFDDLGLEPEIADVGNLKRYGAEGIDIFVGDIFDLDARALGPVDAVYDRAALVALPEETRGRYAAHLAEISGAAPQLLISFDYDQSEMDGPPFSVPEDEIRRCYGARYEMTQIASVEVVGGLKGKCAALEQAWLLRPA